MKNTPTPRALKNTATEDKSVEDFLAALFVASNFAASPAGPEAQIQSAANDCLYTNVGDLQSSTKGSGARFNAGKTPYDLLPVSLIYTLTDLAVGRDEGDLKDQAIVALMYLGLWQERNMTGGIPGQHPLETAMLVFESPLLDTARVFAYGKEKYAAWNWAKGMAWSIPLGCTLRHLLAILDGEINDPESGLPHVGHALCNLTMLWTYDTRGTFLEGDDRPAAGLLAPEQDQTEDIDFNNPGFLL